METRLSPKAWLIGGGIASWVVVGMAVIVILALGGCSDPSTVGDRIIASCQAHYADQGVDAVQGCEIDLLDKVLSERDHDKAVQTAQEAGVN